MVTVYFLLICKDFIYLKYFVFKLAVLNPIWTRGRTGKPSDLGFKKYELIKNLIKPAKTLKRKAKY